MSDTNSKERGIFGSIFLTYFVLILHVVLILLVGVAVVFFRGVVEYMMWILLGGLALTLGSGYYFFRRLRQSNRRLRDIVNDPAFRGRSLEISFLGGLASFRVGNPGDLTGALPHDVSPTVHQLEDPETTRMRDLGRLVRMLENNLITQQEYDLLKKEILHRENPNAFSSGSSGSLN